MRISEDQVQAAIDRAQSNFTNGLNCSESTYEAFIHSGIVNMPKEDRGPCHGFWRRCAMTGGQCGILTGCIMALGAYHAQDPSRWTKRSERDTILSICGRSTPGQFLHRQYGFRRMHEICVKSGGYLAPAKTGCIDMIQR